MAMTPSNGDNGNRARQIGALRRKLLAARRHLTEDLRSFTGRGSACGSGDEADRAMDSLERETAWCLGGAMTESLERIDRALERMQEGTYGRCESCGHEIPFERLQLLPSSTLCVVCKSKEEAAEQWGGRTPASPGEDRLFASESFDESDDGEDWGGNPSRGSRIVSRRDLGASVE